MTDRAAFLRAIADAPEDDAPRLVFADWLDERGDPLGEFIRVQLALEPHRVTLADEVADLRRRHRLACAALPDSADPLAPLLRREAELLRKHGEAWAGPLWFTQNEHGYSHEFRRGFVDEAFGDVGFFAENAHTLADAHPGLRRLVLRWPAGRGRWIADCTLLRQVTELTLTDWPTDDDIAALAASLHLTGVRTLRVWQTEEEVDGNGRRLDLSRSMPDLKELVVVQLRGGRHWESYGHAHHAHASAALADAAWGRPLARVDPWFDRLHPLAGRVGYGLFAGCIPASGYPQSLLVVSGHPLGVVHFDADGRFLGQTDIDPFPIPDANDFRVHDAPDFLGRLRDALGFEAGLIHVREFEAAEFELSLMAWDGTGDEPHPYPSWMRDGTFLIEFGNTYGVDQTGTVCWS